MLAVPTASEIRKCHMHCPGRHTAVVIILVPAALTNNIFSRAKKSQYPYGYPGDVFGENSIPRHECHLCQTSFDWNAPDGTACSNCSHPKCADCPRLKPQKVDPEPDPEILKSLEARLGKLTVGG